MPTLTAPSPAAVSCDAGRAGAHHALAERLVAAIHTIDPDAHACIGDLGWSVRISRNPVARYGLGDITVRVPTPWDVRDGACIARTTEWQVHRSQPWFSPGRYTHNVDDAARLAVALLPTP